MTHEYLYTRQGNQEYVLHVGEALTLVDFRGDAGIAAALAETKRHGGEAAVARELSLREFETVKRQLTLRSRDREAALADGVYFAPIS